MASEQTNVVRFSNGIGTVGCSIISKDATQIQSSKKRNILERCGYLECRWQSDDHTAKDVDTGTVSLTVLGCRISNEGSLGEKKRRFSLIMIPNYSSTLLSNYATKIERAPFISMYHPRRIEMGTLEC